MAINLLKTYIIYNLLIASNITLCCLLLTVKYNWAFMEKKEGAVWNWLLLLHYVLWRWNMTNFFNFILWFWLCLLFIVSYTQRRYHSVVFVLLHSVNLCDTNFLLVLQFESKFPFFCIVALLSTTVTVPSVSSFCEL